MEVCYGINFGKAVIGRGVEIGDSRTRVACRSRDDLELEITRSERNAELIRFRVYRIVDRVLIYECYEALINLPDDFADSHLVWHSVA